MVRYLVGGCPSAPCPNARFVSSAVGRGNGLDDVAELLVVAAGDGTRFRAVRWEHPGSVTNGIRAPRSVPAPVRPGPLSRICSGSRNRLDPTRASRAWYSCSSPGGRGGPDHPIPSLFDGPQPEQRRHDYYYLGSRQHDRS